MNIFKLILKSLLVIITFSFNSCEESTKKEQPSKKDTKEDKEQPSKKDTKEDMGFKFYKFNIPSPIQTAMYIQESGAEFNPELLNPSENADQYSTPLLKAINLGIYSTDLGYCTIYENPDLSIKSMKTVKQSAKYLGLENAYSDELIMRFGENMNNKDSMLVLVSEAFKSTDTYLKQNEKDHIAALVLIGGWIEAMYISCESALVDNNEKIINRIAEQENALSSLIEMLEEIEQKPNVEFEEDWEDLKEEFEELHEIFNDIDYISDNISSEHDKSSKTTTIKSEREIIKTDELMQAITNKLIDIRNEYTQ